MTNIKKQYAAARRILERYKQECEEYGHNVERTKAKRLLLDF